jgi:hypothetical protein
LHQSPADSASHPFAGAIHAVDRVVPAACGIAQMTGKKRVPALSRRARPGARAVRQAAVKNS